MLSSHINGPMSILIESRHKHSIKQFNENIAFPRKTILIRFNICCTQLESMRALLRSVV